MTCQQFNPLVGWSVDSLLYVVVEGIFIATSYALLNGLILPQAFHSHLALRRECIVRTNVSSRRYDTFVLLT